MELSALAITLGSVLVSVLGWSLKKNIDDNEKKIQELRQDMSEMTELLTNIRIQIAKITK